MKKQLIKESAKERLLSEHAELASQRSSNAELL